MKILPFRGYRYDGARGLDLSRVVAPPYDQIDAATCDALHALHPWNFVRITLGRREPGDGDAADQLRRAGEHLDRWVAEQVFIRDAKPALYVYRITYRTGGKTLSRAGVIALGVLTEYAEKQVRPHERTHTGPKAERLAHLEATGADTGLIFMLAPDPAGELQRATAPPPTPAVAAARDLKGELHELWRLSDPAAIGAIQALVAERGLIIADGHHRYETALEYRRQHPGADRKLLAIFPLEGPGLSIYPTHRLLHDLPGFGVEALLARAASWFDVERTSVSGDAAAEAAAIVAALDAQLRRGRVAVAVVSGAEGPGWLLTLRPEAAAAIPWPAGTSLAWRRLAVSVLHEALLKPFVGLTDAMLRQQVAVDYTEDAVEAVSLARKGNYRAGFLIPPPTVSELQAVVEAGELLPQKSTFFYPKLLDGLVFVRLDQEAEDSG